MRVLALGSTMFLVLSLSLSCCSEGPSGLASDEGSGATGSTSRSKRDGRTSADNASAIGTRPTSLNGTRAVKESLTSDPLQQVAYN